MDTVLPVAIVGIAYYWYRQRVPLQLVALAAFLLAASFLVLMPLRQVAQSGDVDVRRVGALADALIEIASVELRTGTPSEGESGHVGEAILERSNQTNIAALALRHHETHPDDPVAAALADEVLLTPAATMIPRALWPSKPRSQDVGHWFYQEVLGGKNQTTLAGPTLVGYLNFVGGLFAVLVGFGVIGVIQRGVHDRLLPVRGGGALLIVLATARILGDLPAQFTGIVALPFRFLPLVLLAQFVIFRARSPHEVP